MARDINEMDQAAQLLRVSWQKANNYYASLARTFIETKAQFDSGIFGPAWPFDKWLLHKAGLSAPFMMEIMLVFKRAIAADQRALLTAEKEERARIRRVVAERRRAETEALRQQRAAEKAAKETERMARRTATKEKEQRKRRSHGQRQRRQREQDMVVAFAKERSLDDLSQEIKAGIAQAAQGREAWIAGTLRQAHALTEARDQFPSNLLFGQWLTINEITYNPHDRAALIEMGRDIKLAHAVLRDTNRSSYQRIWQYEIAPKIEGGDRLAHVSKTENPEVSDQPVEIIH